MKHPFILALVVLIAVQACSEKDEDEPAPVPAAFLSVTVDNTYPPFDDMWAFATDEAGKVLDAHPLKRGTTATFKMLSPPDLINLTIYYYGGSVPVRHMFYTYAGIKRGKEIVLEGAESLAALPSVTGKATISLKNCKAHSNFNLSDGHSLFQTTNQNDASMNIGFDLRQQTSDVLISTHRQMDQPVYGWVNSVAHADVRTIDYQNLSPFPKNISIAFSESISTLIIGRKAGMNNLGYVMANSGFSGIPGNPQAAKFGYLNGFDEYRLFAVSNDAASTYYRTTSYTKNGTSLPDEVTFPDNSLTVKNSAFDNFIFDHSAPYTHSHHTWNHNTVDYVMSWIVYTDKSTTPKIKELPEAFVEKYPSLSIGNLSYVSSDFIKHEDGFTYAQFLDDVFHSGGLSSGPHEFYVDYFQQK